MHCYETYIIFKDYIVVRIMTEEQLYVKYFTATWCEGCQVPAFKKHVETLEKKWIYACYKWETLRSDDRETANGKYPRIEILRGTKVLQILTGVQEIEDTLDMALDNYSDD